MNSVIIEKITDKSDFYYQFDGEIFHIKEGTGDALSEEDIENGIVDYIYYDTYKTLKDVIEDNIDDGGCILLEKLYKDMSVEEIVATVMDFVRA